ncbi:MAG: hypothetical protein A2176_09485 [Spirochaetes bacterium RBG_13_51_14]|nr:MAG: hypothetical protein A2176_09485 [Spirochaetes bacterium RBG_13_51_14]
MKYKAICFIVVIMMASAGCDQKADEAATPPEVLISKGFVDDNTYKVICRGFPKEGMTGVQMVEASKRAALLSAYYYIKDVFGNAVAPDMEGKVEKYDTMKDHVVLHYIVEKKGLRAKARPGAETESVPETAPDAKAH